jgi:hypothetical protein
MDGGVELTSRIGLVRYDGCLFVGLGPGIRRGRLRNEMSLGELRKLHQGVLLVLPSDRLRSSIRRIE